MEKKLMVQLFKFFVPQTPGNCNVYENEKDFCVLGDFKSLDTLEHQLKLITQFSWGF